MKNNMVKKLLTLALAGAMTLSLAACGSRSDDSSNDAQQGGDESGKTYKVAIIKQLDHASLDEIANAVAAELDKIAADNNVTIEYDITSGQNDQSTLKQLSDQAIADGGKLIGSLILRTLTDEKFRDQVRQSYLAQREKKLDP